MKRSLLFISVLTWVLSVSAQENLIENGDFSDTMSSVWTFNANGANATGKIENNRFLISITTPGHNETAPQLEQTGIRLQAGEAYTLRFYASANGTGFIRAVVRNNSTLFTDTALGRVEVRPTGNSYSLDFTVDAINGHARVQFNCGLSDSLTRIAIDSVSLIMKTVPTISITSPQSAERWLTGTERQIAWRNTGILEKVKILYSKDNGENWLNISSAADNFNEFWWAVPASAAGIQCRILVSTVDGEIADTSDLFSIVDPGVVEAGDLIKNGGFVDTSFWRFSCPDSVTDTIINEEFVIASTKLFPNAWDIKLEQQGITLKSGKMYTFSFDAYASSPRELFANVGRVNGGPWSVTGGDTIPVHLTTEKKRFATSFIMAETFRDIRVEFNCGTDTPTIYLDNVSLIETDAPDVFVTKPLLGVILKSGTDFNIEWNSSDIANVNIEYSLDNGDTWELIVESIDNLGAYVWSVPEVSSEKCLIRLVDAAEDTVLGQSAQFQINKFGAPVKTGELIVNGGFTSNLQGWNVSLNNGAQAQATTANEALRISVQNPGDIVSDIILSQGNLQLLTGKEYTLKFDISAAGDRRLAVKLFGAEDSSTVFFVDSTIDVPNVSETFTITFTPDQDAVASLEFHLGGSMALVSIDNVSLYTGPLNRISARRKTAAPAEVFRVLPAQHGKSVSFVFSKGTTGQIRILNLNGMQVRLLQASERVNWDGRDSRGVGVSSGTYIAALKTRDGTMVKRFLLK